MSGYVVAGETLKKKLRVFQSRWMSDNSKSTRSSQWRSYFAFCEEFEYTPPLPASLEMILLYVVHLADRLRYKSITQYLGAVWILHDMFGVDHIDAHVFELTITLRGIKRTLGDLTVQARPATLVDLIAIFNKLDLTLDQDLAFWVAILLGFRGLLRKSNIVEEDMSVKLGDLEWESWGVGVSVRRTKTISFQERVLFIPFVPIKGSIFCICTFLRLLLGRVVYPSPGSQLVGYMSNGTYTRGTYKWYSKKLSNLCKVCELVKLSSHSMRRGGASLLAENGISLIDIKNLGDWKSMSVLFYLTRSLESKIDLDTKITKDIFLNPESYVSD